MSTPTDPYSRPDHEDGHDDILDPLPEDQDNRTEPESDTRPADESVTDPHTEQSDTDTSPAAPSDRATTPPSAHFDESSDYSRYEADSETESTQSWKPDFADDEPQESGAPDETDRERWERSFGSTHAAGDDATIVGESHPTGDQPTQVSTAPADDETGAYPTRTSVFNRGGGETASGSSLYGTTPPEATQQAPLPAERRFDHRFEEPVPEAPRGRGWAHVGVFFATLLLAPLAWYLVADAGVRLSGLEDSAWQTGTVDWIVVLELLGALLCLGVLWFLASLSSIGPIVIGLIIAIAGLIAVFAPTLAQDVLESTPMQDFAAFNDFTGNVGRHLTSDLASGRLAVYGFLLLMTGVVSHNARQHGFDRGETLGRRGVLLSRKSDA